MEVDLEKSLSNIYIKDENENSCRPTTTNSNENGSFSSSKKMKSEDMSSDDENRDKFMRLIKEARHLAESGDVAKAVQTYQKAQNIHYSKKLEQRIEKMKAFLAEQAEEEEKPKNGMKEIGMGFHLHQKLYDQLYDHQKEGVLWLYTLYKRQKGGILADDMGLGKTIQIIAFLAGMFDAQSMCVMIVVPLSVMPNWHHEFKKWTPGINVQEYHGTSKKERERALSKVRARGGVLLITYGLVLTTKEVLAEKHGQEFCWDYIILDEGHKIKNPTKTSKSLHLVPAKNRIILTGTPVQNNLKELWSLFDYAHQGTLLGTLRTFKMEFETPIIRAREKDATMVEKKLGQEMAETLKNIIKPYFLRRTKDEVQANKASESEDSKSAQMPTLTRKNDLVVWLKLTEAQQRIYKDFLALDHVKELLMTKKSPLVALTVLKKICDHPRLLSTRACLQLGLDGDDFDEEVLENAESYESAVSQIKNIPDDILINESGKMIILIELLRTFKQEGRKTLIFSQSRKILDIIQKILSSLGHKMVRLDGTINNLSARDDIVQRFQRDPSITVFLLTIQVGGVGLTITAADRVIIYDPSWNPSTDAQAVDRAYRIGQQKNVVVYRLITCGTVEEKIYRRQVFKDSITRQTTGNTKNPYRYFTNMELKELFILDDPTVSKTQQQLEELHSHEIQTDQTFDEHLAYLYSLDIFGISHHDLMYKQGDIHDTENADENVHEDAGFIQHKVQKAQMLIAEESTVPSTYEERSKGMKKYPNGPSGPAPATGAVAAYRLTNYISPPTTSALFRKVGSSGDSEDDPMNISNNSTESLESNMENMSVHQDNVSSDRLLVLSPSKTLQSPSSKARTPLGPLTPDEVRKRSPLLVSRPDKVVKEEIIISPDPRSPIIKLEKSGYPHGLSPVKLFKSSPKKKENAVPKLRAVSSLVDSPNVEMVSSPRTYSTPISTKGKISKRIATDAILLKDSSLSSIKCEANTVLVEASPISPLLINSSARSSVSSTPHMDLSVACRKLSFVADTPEAAQVGSSSRRLVGGPCGDFVPSTEATQEKSKGRRSVCLPQAVDLASNDSECELSFEQSCDVNEEEGEDDKENEPVQFRRAAGKRNAIISDSESENGSYYEVSEDDEPYLSAATNFHQSQAEVSMAAEEEENEMEEEEVEEEDAEEDEEILDPVFIQLVKQSKQMYKQQNFAKSLEYLDKALEIKRPTELEEMRKKIEALKANQETL